MKLPSPRQSLAVVGAALGILAMVILALTTWARHTDLGPPVTVDPSIRAWDAGRRRVP